MRNYVMKSKVISMQMNNILMTKIGCEVLEHMHNKNIVKVTIHPPKDNKRTHTGSKYYEIIATYKQEVKNDN